MKLIKVALLLIHIPIMVSCFTTHVPEIILVGSTPGDDPIKSMFSIPATIQVDFIKWNLKLKNNKTFELTISYGESQPNTLEFKSDGQTNSFRGSFVIDRLPENKHLREIYQLNSNSIARTISLVRLNDNLFHILTSDNQLMVGNGGWSYSLNRSIPVHSDEILISSAVSDEKALQIVYDGRTPCQEISAEHSEMNASSSCFKLKWKLILNRDSITYSPTTCVIRKVVDNQARDVTGKWTIIQGTTENPDVVIYKIETDHPGTPILFLAGDDHVLFFLDKNGNPFIGNENFSFVLNRRAKE